MPDIASLEQQLDHFDPAVREDALGRLLALVQRGEIALPPAGTDLNLHCHTFFSYNVYGYSPTKLAWLGRKAGWAVAGIVDFDVLDGLEEFLRAGCALGLKTCGGLETRVFIPEFADSVINSPGEPGISYHMGVGFPGEETHHAALDGPTPRLLDSSTLRSFISRLRRTSEERNRGLVTRVNAYLAPAALDYDRDVLVLTPAGNATERHICLAYAQRAHALFPQQSELAAFWSEKLGVDPGASGALDLPEGPKLQALIRAKTMKRGGVGYVQPDRGSFPWLAETNRFLLDAGAIPTHTWLDGTSDGEQRIEELLQVAMASGVAAINLIPDRNYGQAGGDEKLRNLYHVVEVAQKLHLLLVIGTEMNNAGQKLVDDLGSPELAPLAPAFLQSAYAIYAHSVLQRQTGCGYTSPWAERFLPDRQARNELFSELGRRLQPDREILLRDLQPDAAPQQILKSVT